MIFIVVTNVIASRPPERQTTGLPQNCAKNIKRICFCGNIEDMKHSCKIFIVKRKRLNMKIFVERKVFRIFQNNFEMREQYLKQTENPWLPGRVDPL